MLYRRIASDPRNRRETIPKGRLDRKRNEDTGRVFRSDLGDRTSKSSTEFSAKNTMSSPIIFYAWQNDRPRQSCREFVRTAAGDATSRIAASLPLEDSPRLDHDTENESGTPPITETILRKIRLSAVFIADVTFCAEIREGDPPKIVKRYPNPNVMLELGYAAAILGWNRIVLVMNKHYGSAQSLPFDLKNHRFPIEYELGPNSGKSDELRSALADRLEEAIRACLVAEYQLAETTLAKLPTSARNLMRKFGPAGRFHETGDDNAIYGRETAAIELMLSLGLIACLPSEAPSGADYGWTYLGKQCCYKLGLVEPPASPAHVNPEQPKYIMEFRLPGGIPLPDEDRSE